MFVLTISDSWAMTVLDRLLFLVVILFRGGSINWGYLQIIPFNRIFMYFLLETIQLLGYSHFWNPPKKISSDYRSCCEVCGVRGTTCCWVSLHSSTTRHLVRSQELEEGTERYLQWIGLKENLQETIYFSINFGVFLDFFPSTNP